jgi:chromosome segregation ATPase
MAEMIAVRASEELQAKFKKFADEGDFKNNGEFLSHLLTLHAAQETGQKIPTLEGAITAVKDLTDRVMNILIGAGEVMIANEEKRQTAAEAICTEAEAKANAAIVQVESLKVEAGILKGEIDAAKSAASEAQKRIVELEGINSDKSALVDELKLKIDGLETVIARQTRAVQEAKDAKGELNELHEKTHNLKTEMERQKEQTIFNLREAKCEHETEMERLKISHEKALFEVEKRLNTESRDREAKAAAEAGERQAKHTAQIDGYEKKVMALMDELNDIRAAVASQPSSEARG